MSLAQRLEAMELLWSSISRAPDEVPSPAWHEEIVRSRLAKIERGQAEFLTISELKERLENPPA